VAETDAVARALRPRVRCTYCHDGIERGDAVHCASCLAPHHAECHGGHGRCAAPGCDDPRALVPDPDGRPARAVIGTGPKEKPRARRWRALAALLLLAPLSAWLAWPREEAVAPATVAHAPVVFRAVAQQVVERERVVLVERISRDVALVARDFRLPVTLAAGERLVVQPGARGYTHVVLEPPAGSGRAPEARLVAEPGDPIDVVTGPRGSTERLRAGPGEAIVLEPVGPDGAMRVALERGRP
jgi:hypothetical protein